jgi:hypothetical protein
VVGKVFGILWRHLLISSGFISLSPLTLFIHPYQDSLPPSRRPPDSHLTIRDNIHNIHPNIYAKNFYYYNYNMILILNLAPYFSSCPKKSHACCFCSHEK